MVDEILIDMKWRAIYSSQSANTGSCIIKFAQKHSKYLFNYLKKTIKPYFKKGFTNKLL